MEEARLQPVAFVDETDAPTGSADGGNPDRKGGWQWVMMTPVGTVFLQGLSRSSVAAFELLGTAFAGIVVSDRFSAYNHLASSQRQLCWAHLIRDFTAIAERQGVSGEIGLEPMALQKQPTAHGHHHLAAPGPAYRAVPGSGCPSSRWCDALIATGSVMASGQHAAPIANVPGWIGVPGGLAL
jgi:hypothetical protein